MTDIDHVIYNLSLFTDNTFLKEYVKNSILRVKGKFRINIVGLNKCLFAFKNSSGEHVYIEGDMDKLYVYSDASNYHEDVVYYIDEVGIHSEYNYFSTESDASIKQVKCINENCDYDLNGKFISRKCHIEERTFLDNEVLKNLKYTNYDKYISDYLVDDKLFREEKFDYNYTKDMNRTIYYVSEYADGMFCSVNSSINIKPDYIPINGSIDFYLSKINLLERKNVQNIKTMI